MSLSSGFDDNEGLHQAPLAAGSAVSQVPGPVSFPGTLNKVLLAVMGSATAALALVLGVHIDPLSFTPYAIIILTCILLNVYVSRRNGLGARFRQRMQLVLKGVVFIFVALATFRIFNHLTMSLAFPLADPLLDGWDKALGFDWMAYFAFVQAHALVAVILKVAYVGFDGASLLGFLALVWMGHACRVRYFCEIFLVTAAICTTIAMFFPAEAAVVHNFGYVSEMDGFGTVPGVYHMDQFLMLRAAETPSINLLAAQGLATFPSFHAAGGILLIAGFLKTRFSWIVIVFSVTMIASVPVFGAHYFIDVLAGTALAVAVSVLNAMRPCYRGMFTNATARKANLSGKDSRSLASSAPYPANRSM